MFTNILTEVNRKMLKKVKLLMYTIKRGRDLMADVLSIIKMKQWVDGGCYTEDFYDIFNIPSQTNVEISTAIDKLRELFDNFSQYMASADNKKNKIEKYFNVLFSDIFGELAASIKLAGEGYISYSLREIRSVLDLFYAGLFTISSWPPKSIDDEEGVNPMAEAFMSGYWGKTEEFNLDDLILPEIQFGQNTNSVIASLDKLSEKFYPEIISEFKFDKNTIKTKEEQEIKKLLKDSLGKFFINFIKKSNLWPNIKKEVLGNREYFYWALMKKEEITLKSCKIHVNDMLKDLAKKLRISGELTDEIIENLSTLTFEGPEFNDIECQYCKDENNKNKATFYGIYLRPSTISMSKLIKSQLPKEELDGINSCITESFKRIGIQTKKPYFGEIIHSELYTKLNDYVHSNIVEEPNIYQWFYKFFIPTIVVLQCILTRPL